MRKDEYYGRKSLSLQFYDVLTELDQSIRGDVAFYAQGLAPADVVLDIGCGTGRVSLALAQLGLRVVGIDLAETMIAQARQKLRQLPPSAASRVQFLVSDMVALDLPVRFHRVIIPFYTLNLLPSRARRAEALKVAARHLVAGGTLMIHTIPVERLRMQKPAVSQADGADITVAFDNGTRLELTWGDRKVDAERQSTHQHVIYRHRSADGALLDESTEDLVFAWISDKELQVAAAKAGLVVAEILKSFVEGEAGNEKIFVLAKRA
jgi:SAM-dependent methyltransferase